MEKSRREARASAVTERLSANFLKSLPCCCAGGMLLNTHGEGKLISSKSTNFSNNKSALLLPKATSLVPQHHVRETLTRGGPGGVAVDPGTPHSA